MFYDPQKEDVMMCDCLMQNLKATCSGAIGQSVVMDPCGGHARSPYHFHKVPLFFLFITLGPRVE